MFKDEWIQTIKEDNIGLYNFLNGVKNLSSINSSKNNKHYVYNYCYLAYMSYTFNRNAKNTKRHWEYLFTLRF